MSRTAAGSLVVLMLLLAGPAAAGDAASSPFRFGSYGRVIVASDGDGARGEPISIVPWAPRLIETSYLETDFGYRAWSDGPLEVDTVLTLAFGDDFFHSTTQFGQSIAIRQAYLEARNLGIDGLSLWVGSRMYRGDDIYLIDFWPLDEQNTVGLGVGWRHGDLDLKLHAGLSRPEDPFHVQRISVPVEPLGETDATVLDRQRQVVTSTAEYFLSRGEGGALGMKLKLHGELHHLPAGTRTLDAVGETEPLPDDLGWMLGVQYGLWNYGRNSHLNLFLRWARGLAAYSELAVPSTFNRDRRVVDAEELRAALSGNWETELGDGLALGVMYGGWIRSFVDADADEEDFDDRVEGAGVVRPLLFIGRYFTPGVEASVQLSRPNGLHPRTLRQEIARVVQLGVIPAFTFGGDPVGSYTRPQLRFIYAVSFLNDAALSYYPEQDPRAANATVHYFGAGAEWWFGRGGGY